MAAAGFVQRASTGEVAGVAAVGVLLEGQRRVVGDCTLQAAGVASSATAVQRGATAVGVGAAEQQVAAAVFHQTAGAGNSADQRSVLVAGQCQLGAQVDGVGQLQRRGAVQRAVAEHTQCTAADCAVVAENQRAATQLGATGVSIAAIERQARSSGFDQTAAAADDATEGQGVGAGDAQSSVEHHVIAEADGGVAAQRSAVRCC